MKLVMVASMGMLRMNRKQQQEKEEDDDEDLVMMLKRRRRWKLYVASEHATTGLVTDVRPAKEAQGQKLISSSDLAKHKCTHLRVLPIAGQ